METFFDWLYAGILIFLIVYAVRHWSKMDKAFKQSDTKGIIYHGITTIIVVIMLMGGSFGQ